MWILRYTKSPGLLRANSLSDLVSALRSLMCRGSLTDHPRASEHQWIVKPKAVRAPPQKTLSEANRLRRQSYTNHPRLTKVPSQAAKERTTWWSRSSASKLLWVHHLQWGRRSEVYSMTLESVISFGWNRNWHRLLLKQPLLTTSLATHSLIGLVSSQPPSEECRKVSTVSGATSSRCRICANRTSTWRAKWRDSIWRWTKRWLTIKLRPGLLLEMRCLHYRSKTLNIHRYHGWSQIH